MFPLHYRDIFAHIGLTITVAAQGERFPRFGMMTHYTTIQGFCRAQRLAQRVDSVLMCACGVVEAARFGDNSSDRTNDAGFRFSGDTERERSETTAVFNGHRWNSGRGVRVVDGAALEKRSGDEPAWVRIPPSPPYD